MLSSKQSNFRPGSTGKRPPLLFLSLSGGEGVEGAVYVVKNFNEGVEGA
jgi:hypothetical protein